MNSTISSMQKTLTDKEKTIWNYLANKLTFVYNCTKHSSIGYSPYHLLFGYKPPLPINLILDQNPKVNVISNDQHLAKWEEAMRQAHNIHVFL